ELGQAPGERGKRPPALATVHIGRRGLHPSGEAERGQVLRVGMGDDLLDQGDLARSVRHAVRLLQQGPQLFFGVAHRILSTPDGDGSGGMARSSSPRNDRFSRAASAGRIGWYPSSSAWPYRASTDTPISSGWTSSVSRRTSGL